MISCLSVVVVAMIVPDTRGETSSRSKADGTTMIGNDDRTRNTTAAAVEEEDTGLTAALESR